MQLLVNCLSHITDLISSSTSAFNSTFNPKYKPQGRSTSMNINVMAGVAIHALFLIMYLTATVLVFSCFYFKKANIFKGEL